MATTVKELAITLSAQTAQFEKSMNRASLTLKETEKSTKSLAASFINMKTVSAAAMVYAMKQAATSIRDVVDEQIGAISVLSKMSNRINITAGDLQGLQKAAEFTGSSAESMSAGLLEMQANLDMAARGSYDMRGALNYLGISLQDIEGMDAGARFRLIAERMMGMEKTAMQSKVAMDLFGGSAGDMLRVAGQGAEMLDQFALSIDKAGMGFDQLSGAEAELLQKSIGQIKDALTGVWRQITLHLIPYLQAATDWIIKMGNKGAGMKQVIGGAFEFVAKWIAKAADMAQSLYKGFLSLKFVAQVMGAGIIMAVHTIQTGFLLLWQGVITAGQQAFLDVVSGARGMANGIIEALNKVPGVKIDLFEKSRLEKSMEHVVQESAKTFESIKSIAKKENEIITGELTKNIDATAAQINKLAKAESWSTKALRWSNDIRANSNKQAAELVKKTEKELELKKAINRLDVGSFQEVQLGAFAFGGTGVKGAMPGDATYNRLGDVSFTETNGILRDIKATLSGGVVTRLA